MIGMKAKPKNPMKVVPTGEQFSIRLYNESLEDYSKILFGTAEIKSTYVSAEYKAVFPEYVQYWGASTLEKRSKAFALLCAKRIVFAKSRGYGPKRTNKKEWVLLPTKETPKTLA